MEINDADTRSGAGVDVCRNARGRRDVRTRHVLLIHPPSPPNPFQIPSFDPRVNPEPL